MHNCLVPMSAPLCSHEFDTERMHVNFVDIRTDLDVDLPSLNDVGLKGLPKQL